MYVGCGSSIPPLPHQRFVSMKLPIYALGNALTTSQFGHGFPTEQAIQHDADLFFRRILLACCPADILDRHGGTGLSCL